MWWLHRHPLGPRRAHLVVTKPKVRPTHPQVLLTPPNPPSLLNFKVQRYKMQNYEDRERQKLRPMYGNLSHPIYNLMLAKFGILTPPIYKEGTKWGPIHISAIAVPLVSEGMLFSNTDLASSDLWRPTFIKILLLKCRSFHDSDLPHVRQSTFVSFELWKRSAWVMEGQTNQRDLIAGQFKCVPS